MKAACKDLPVEESERAFVIDNQLDEPTAQAFLELRTEERTELIARGPLDRREDPTRELKSRIKAIKAEKEEGRTMLSEPSAALGVTEGASRGMMEKLERFIAINELGIAPPPGLQDASSDENDEVEEVMPVRHANQHRLLPQVSKHHRWDERQKLLERAREAEKKGKLTDADIFGLNWILGGDCNGPSCFGNSAPQELSLIHI